jgi:hypothetical protein
MLPPNSAKEACVTETDGSSTDGASSLPAPEPLPPKGVADLLGEALQLYRKHAKALLLTCALLFVPASLIKSWAVATIFRADGPTAAAVQEMRSAAGELDVARRALDDAYARHADPQTIERLRTQLQRDADRTMSAVQARFGSGTMLLGLLGMAVTLFFLYAIIVPLTNAALTIAAGDRILGGEAGWREVWMLLFRRLDKLLGAVLPAALMIGLGLILIVPGIVFAVLFAFVSPVVLIEGKGGSAALRRSVELVKSDWLRVVLLGVVFLLLQAVATLVARAIIPHSAVFLDSVIGDLVQLVLLPIPVLGTVLLYFDIRRRRDNFTDDNLRTELAALRG